jgi:hypothetical protein
MLVSISEGVPVDYKAAVQGRRQDRFSAGFSRTEYESFGYGEILVALDNEKYTATGRVSAVSAPDAGALIVPGFSRKEDLGDLVGGELR